MEHRRSKLVSNIEEQIELAERALAGTPLQLKRKRGHRIVDVRPRLWWKTDSEGNIFTQVLFNKVALDIGGRGTAIEVGLLSELPSIYRILTAAVEEGELDLAIENAAAGHSARRS